MCTKISLPATNTGCILKQTLPIILTITNGPCQNKLIFLFGLMYSQTKSLTLNLFFLFVYGLLRILIELFFAKNNSFRRRWKISCIGKFSVSIGWGVASEIARLIDLPVSAWNGDVFKVLLKWLFCAIWKRGIYCDQVFFSLSEKGEPLLKCPSYHCKPQS